MKSRLGRKISRWLLCALLTSSPMLLVVRSIAAAEQPNFIVILADDQGWAGTDVPMDPKVDQAASPWFPAPNLHRLARRGIRFSQGYAPAPKCSPTRAALLTGRTPARLHYTENGTGPNQEQYSRQIRGAVICPNGENFLTRKHMTIAEWFDQNAPEYVTAHFGKWHVGKAELGPESRGFDESDGPTNNREGIPVLKDRGKTITNYGPDDPKQIFSLTKRAIDFVQRRVTDDKPFFMQVSHYAVHGPQVARAETVQQVESRNRHSDAPAAVYCAMSMDLDTGLGMLLDTIDALDLWKNTYVIYLSDNGAAGRNLKGNGPLAKAKSWTWEGGIRVPFVVAGPGVPADVVCHEPVVGIDIFPTVADLLGKSGTIPAEVDGGSMLPALRNPVGGKITRPREGLLFHVGRYFANAARTDRLPNIAPHTAYREGDWKIVKEWDTQKLTGPEVHLYNLNDDIGEQHDLASAMPEKTRQMEAKMLTFLKAVDANIPEPNPDFVQGGSTTMKPKR